MERKEGVLHLSFTVNSFNYFNTNDMNLNIKLLNNKIEKHSYNIIVRK